MYKITCVYTGACGLPGSARQHHDQTDRGGRYRLREGTILHYYIYHTHYECNIVIISHTCLHTHIPTNISPIYTLSTLLYMHTIIIIYPLCIHLIYTHIQYNRLLVHLKDYHNERVIIFAETKKGVDQLTRSLRGQNFPAQGVYVCIFIYA